MNGLKSRKGEAVVLVLGNASDGYFEMLRLRVFEALLWLQTFSRRYFRGLSSHPTDSYFGPWGSPEGLDLSPPGLWARCVLFGCVPAFERSFSRRG